MILEVNSYVPRTLDNQHVKPTGHNARGQVIGVGDNFIHYILCTGHSNRNMESVHYYLLSCRFGRKNSKPLESGKVS